MADEMAEKIAEAKKKMFGNLQPAGGKTVILVSGDGVVESKDNTAVVRRVER